MQVVLFCGGKGTRLSEITEKLPKPLIKVGGKPILHCLMDYYASFGHRDFVLLLGYKGEKIREYFKNFDGWNIKFADTGEESNKAERLLKARGIIKDETFFLSYGDDLSDVDLHQLLAFHKSNNKLVTLTAVPLLSPFGILEVNKSNEVIMFREKPVLDYLMSGGFYVVNRKLFNYIKPGHDLETEVFEELTKDRQIAAFSHNGFWKSMNTLKDVIELNEIAKLEKVPWKR